MLPERQNSFKMGAALKVENWPLVDNRFFLEVLTHIEKGSKTKIGRFASLKKYLFTSTYRRLRKLKPMGASVRSG